MQFNYFCVLGLCAVLLDIAVAGENKTCQQDLQVVKEKRLGAIRNQILSKLNMTKAPPNPQKPLTLSPHIMDAYYVIKDAFERDAIAKSTGCVDNNYFSRKVSLFNPMPAPQYDSIHPTLINPVTTHNNDGTLNGATQEGQNLSFSISLPSGSSNEIDYAEIRLRKSCLPEDFQDYSAVCHAEDLYATVEIYNRINTVDGTRKIFVTARSLILNDGNRWEDFVITEAVQQCLLLSPQLNKAELNLELEIRLNDPSSYPNPYKFFDNSDASLTNTTQLVVFAVNKKDVENERRRKRQLTRDFCFANFTTNCCVRNLTINFHEDLNWTWVLAPDEYQPNYCSGGCPYLWPSATLFASALQTLKFLNPAASAEPCCVPATLLPLTIIRLDENEQLVFEPLSDMIVDSCICR